MVEQVSGNFDVNELRVTEATELRENDIGVVRLRTATRLAIDPYDADRITGSFVLIDEQSFATVAAGMVGPPRLHD
jgi:sulfate adenylyltransferase subunit 1 (EFTu-like GTPase family)